MAEDNLLIRFFLEYAMLIPGTIGFLLPIRKFTRFDRRMIIGTAAALNVVLVFGGTLFSCFTGISTNLVMAGMLLISLGLALFMIDLQRTQILFAYCNAIMFCAWSNVITLYAFAHTEVDNPDVPFEVASGLMCLLIAFLLLLLFGKMLFLRFPVMFQLPELDFMWKYLWLCPAVATAFLFWVIPKRVDNILVGRILEVSIVIWIMIMAAIYCFYQFLWQFSEKLTREQHLIEEMRVLNAEKVRFSQMEDYVHELRSLRHDLRQHLRVLSAMASSGQHEEMKQYIQKYVETVQPEHAAFCANYAVDAIAAYYHEYAEKKGVEIFWNLFLPPSLQLDETELCVIIGNLLENAIRASEKVKPEKRIIEVSVRMVGDNMIGIEIRNRYTDKITLNRGGVPMSKNRDGIGLYSVSNAVRKNNGTLTVEVNDEWFCVDIIINILSKRKQDEPASVGRAVG